MAGVLVWIEPGACEKGCYRRLDWLDRCRRLVPEVPTDMGYGVFVIILASAADLNAAALFAGQNARRMASGCGRLDASMKRIERIRGRVDEWGVTSEV
jgi:hypothetical protein